MPSKRLPHAETPCEKKAVQDVQEHGWHVIKVMGDDAAPGWAYTVGLLHSYDHPELILFGLPPDTAHALLNIAGRAVKAGKVFEPGVAYGDFTEGHEFVLKRTDPQWHQAIVGSAIWFYQRADFPLMQVFWPDREGAMPWEPEASDWHRANQPSLHEASVESARLGPLLDAMEILQQGRPRHIDCIGYICCTRSKRVPLPQDCWFHPLLRW